ncbi:hypothetical protein JB92DRAFT_2923357 [Gautieria morchelliformis]|nr:hypothetical protein JB92DRAFT_2923357 [Gautieria morchelliformis]
MWLRAYTDEHAELDHSDPTMAAQLSHSVISATRTYVQPDAPYELNLTDQNRTHLLALPVSPPPPPSVYDAAQKEVKWLLEDSLRRWEQNAKSNAGWRRLAFSTYVGLANACITVTAMVLARVYMHGLSGRILAACLTPWLWFAIVGVVCGLKGMCVLCYSVGGSVRQVSSFELSLPRMSLSAHLTATSMPTRSVTTLEPPESPTSPRSDKTGISMSDKLEPHDPFSPHSARGSEFIIPPTANLHNRPAAKPKVKIVEFWAPMVEVEDPVIIRAYWETVVKGFLWSLLSAIPIGVIAAAV